MSWCDQGRDNLPKVTLLRPLSAWRGIGQLLIPVVVMDNIYIYNIYIYEWEFQDPKMEVLYHIRPYFMEMFPYIGLIQAFYIYI